MIVQILLGILLIPLTILLLLAFNLYVINIGYLLVTFGFFFLYAACWAWVASASITWLLFIMLVAAYLLRMVHLSYALRTKNYPAIHGYLRDTSSFFSTRFIIPLYFLNFFKKLPQFIHAAIFRETGVHMSQLIDAALMHSKGVKFEIKNKYGDVHIEIR